MLLDFVAEVSTANCSQFHKNFGIERPSEIYDSFRQTKWLFAAL